MLPYPETTAKTELYGALVSKKPRYTMHHTSTMNLNGQTLSE